MPTDLTSAELPGAPERISGHDPQAGDPVAIEIRDVSKTFRIPTDRIDTFKERAVHPFRPNNYRTLKALESISLDIRKGEFFGIVGRNGSGKSTLLKILASIYRADSGTVRMAGRLAPFIELGVGFDPDLAARDNIILNGVMMGLSQAEAKDRVDAVLEFAELEEFADLKLKNYSSGMAVRLAFSVMLQSEADILLIDEVLAVGDASFQQKCADVFHDMRDSGRTVVLVTHDMGAVQTYCNRAMLIHDAEVHMIGDPEEVGREYLRLNFARDPSGEGGDALAVPGLHARVVDAWLEDEGGVRIDNLEGDQKIRIKTVIEARERLDNPVLGFHLYNADNLHIFGFNHKPFEDEDEDEDGDGDGDGDGEGSVAAGERMEVSFELDNHLTNGHYFLRCWVTRDRQAGDMALQAIDLLDFVVFNVTPAPGVMTVEPEVDTRIEG
ncbi:MAG: ABC transporter ATP-binding protein [Solirubrobacterales bacterium]|nr:ABC transporter ATP-binding protein [Solirubrobacterales bacterium]MCB8971228.1 ABC transporter ATP-binding protein [Thermoleophilales bacterium]MCO5325917.1 ABC transporter ATP-binding protein [Solirubrobacterales bacterium]